MDDHKIITSHACTHIHMPPHTNMISFLLDEVGLNSKINAACPGTASGMPQFFPELELAVPPQCTFRDLTSEMRSVTKISAAFVFSSAISVVSGSPF